MQPFSRGGFGGGGGAGGAGTSNATSIDSITVDMTGIESGDILTYNGSDIVPAKAGITHRDDSDGTIALVAGDRGTLVIGSHATASAVSIAQAGTTGFEEGFYVHYCTSPSGGLSTITPTTSTIAGRATLTLSAGDCALIVSDGTNYQAGMSRRFYQFTYQHWGTGASSVIQDTDDVPDLWICKFPMQITEICGKADTGTSTFNLQKDDGSAASIAASNIVAATTEACTSSFTAGENILAVGNSIDFLQVTGATSGSPTRIAVTVSYLRI